MKIEFIFVLLATTKAVTLRGPKQPATYPHKQIYERVVQAFNNRQLLPSLVDLFDESGGTFCNPYPNCVEGHLAIKAALTDLSNALINTYLIALPLSNDTAPFSGISGGFWAPSQAFSLFSDSNPDGCVVGSPQYVQWDFKAGTSYLSSLSIYFDSKTRWDQATKCAGRCGEPDRDEARAKCEADAAKIVMGGGEEVGGAAEGLAARFSDFYKINNNLHSNTPEWVQGWVGLFANNPSVAQCDPFGTVGACAVGKDAIRAKFQKFQKVLQATLAFNVGAGPVGRGFMMSKNTGFQFNSYISTERDTGCLQNHVQFTVFQLADDLKHLQTIKIFYSEDTHNFANCRHNVSKYLMHMN